MDANTTAARVTRRTCYRGQYVTVTLKNDETITGTLAGWGAYSLRIVPNGGKQRDLSTTQIRQVVTA